MSTLHKVRAVTSYFHLVSASRSCIRVSDLQVRRFQTPFLKAQSRQDKNNTQESTTDEVDSQKKLTAALESKVVGPVAAVLLSLQTEGVLWKRGLLATPKVKHSRNVQNCPDLIVLECHSLFIAGLRMWSSKACHAVWKNIIESYRNSWFQIFSNISMLVF